MRMQSKQEAARTPLVRMRAALRLQYHIYHERAQGENAGGEEEGERGEPKETMRTPRQVLKLQQEQ